MKIRIYTDGACSGNPGTGGWAAVFSSQSGFEVIKGCEAVTTNNRMELKAVIESYKKVLSLKNPDKIDFELFSDSAYVVNSINNKWIENWKRNNWQTSKGDDVKNKDLWEDFIAVRDEANMVGVFIKMKKIKGHSGNTLNERVDKIAREESMKVKG